MLLARLSGAFKRDRKRAERRRKDLTVLDSVMQLLAEEVHLERSFLDHKLKGEWSGHRECHLEPDWLLIYRVIGNETYFVATGTHSDLFE